MYVATPPLEGAAGGPSSLTVTIAYLPSPRASSNARPGGGHGRQSLPHQRGRAATGLLAVSWLCILKLKMGRHDYAVSVSRDSSCAARETLGRMALPQ